MEFFPLTLGLPRPRPPRGERGDPGEGGEQAQSPRGGENAWRESLSAPPEEVEEVPHAAVIEGLRAALPDRPWVILGEPGAGKTRLLAHWHETWLQALSPPGLGTALPVLVRLREFGPEGFRGTPAEVADRLWQHGLAAGLAAARGHSASAALALPCRLFTPVWLLDGLDELEGHPGDAGVWDGIGALPGAVVLSCRTAVFQQLRRDLAGRHAPPWRILGLKPGDEQAAYLRLALSAAGKDPASATDLTVALNAHAALRLLAASPLLLALVAEVADTMSLPGNRAAFYAEATRTLWQRKLADRPALRALTEERDQVLASLAGEMGLAQLEAGESALRAAGITGPLREALRASGLLTFDERRERASFPHLTFQEFHLARSWLSRPLREVLEEQWADARMEEALGLLLALHESEGRGAEVEATLQAFVDQWHERHRSDASVLWRIGRSPGHTALRIAGRSGVSLADPLLGIHRRLFGSGLSYLAGLLGLSGAALWALAERGAGLALAQNPETPPDLLASLAKHGCSATRGLVAVHRRTPASVLSVLATDTARTWIDLQLHPRSWECQVRHVAAANPSMPPQVLRSFLEDWSFRRVLSGNPATPSDILHELAFDADVVVRQLVAQNAASSTDTLQVLARDENWQVRSSIGRNPSVPRSLMAELAQDRDPNVRRAIASNSTTSPGLLASLAADRSAETRAEVAANPATPTATLAALALDPDAYVRRCLAENDAAPLRALVLLAADRDPNVRWRVAENPATSLSMLADLARDGDPYVRRCVADNPSTPRHALLLLAHDRDEYVREGVVANAIAPPEALAAARRPADAYVRWGGPTWSSTILEDFVLRDR